MYDVLMLSDDNAVESHDCHDHDSQVTHAHDDTRVVLVGPCPVLVLDEPKSEIAELTNEP